MGDFYVKIGDVAHFSKTVSESDVYLFAGITGDFAPNHVNKAVMEKSSYRKPIAHGALMVGFMSTTSTMIIANKDWNKSGETPVSLGYDRVRFLAPVFFGDTINVEYTISAIDPVETPRDRRYRDHQSGRHAGRGRDPYPEMGQERLRCESVSA